MGEPPQRAADWDRLRSLIEAVSRNSLGQQRVAAARDIPGFEHTLNVADSLHARIVPLGRSLGFGSSSACGRYFG